MLHPDSFSAGRLILSSFEPENCRNPLSEISAGPQPDLSGISVLAGSQPDLSRAAALRPSGFSSETVGL